MNSPTDREIHPGNPSRTGIAEARVQRRRIAGCVTATAVMALCHGPAAAVPLVETTAQTGNTSGNDLQSGTGGTVSSQKSGSYADSYAAANSQASFGVLRTFAEAHMPYTGGGGGVSAGSKASFQDDFTINSPGKFGEAGTMTIKLSVHGSLTGDLRAVGSEQFTQQSYSSADLYISKTGGGDAVFNNSMRYRLYDQATTLSQGVPFLNQVSTFTLPIIFGTPFQVKITLQSGTFGREKFGADCTSDLGNTGEWGGIASVTDNGGNPVTGYSVVSTTGTDYTRPIHYAPEVTEFALTGAVPGVSFTTLAGRSYTVERSGLLESSSWAPLSNGVNITGTGGVMRIEDTELGAGSQSARFYRVGLKP